MPTPAHLLERHPPIAVCSVDVAAVAIAPCFFQFAATDASTGTADTTRIWVQLTPAGDFVPRDGRELPVAHWHTDATSAAATIAAFRAQKTPPVIDYEHQTLLAEDNGQPAPAAGRIVDMQWREGQGLFGLIELTARARQYIADGEYRYFSPVFTYDPDSGNVLSIVMGALTNHPALDGMQPVALRAAASARFVHPQEPSTVNKILAALIAAFALPDDANEDQAIAALTARLAADPLPKVRAALGAAADADEAAVLAACTALKAGADPARFIAIDAFNQVKTQLAALTAQVEGDKVSALVADALADGRLLAAQEAWARDLGKKDFASLKAYIDSAQPIAALRGTQTGGKSPAGDDKPALSAEELAVCRATGIDPKDFAATKAELAAA